MHGPHLISEAPHAPLRVVLVDANPVFRGACRALLITEGIDVVADLAPDIRAVEVVQRLRPDVVLTEAGGGAAGAPEVASLLCSLPDPPIVLLISTQERPDLAASIGAHGYLAKADVFAAAIASAVGSRAEGTSKRDDAPSLPSH